MVSAKKNTVALLFIVAGIVSLVVGGSFIFQGFDKANLIAEAMTFEKVSYNSAGGEIVGIVDTPEEARAMAGILREHRTQQFGYYTQLKRDDPGRQQILNAMTMENALNLAALGYGITDMAKALGAFIGILGSIFIASGVVLTRPGKITLQ